MAVKKTAAEQNAENAVSAEPAQSKPGVSIYVGPSILGYIQKKPDTLIEISQVDNYPPEQVVIISTGSQGEPMSALTRIAFSNHREIEIQPGDTVIISATPIPGNEKPIYKVINELYRRGVPRELWDEALETAPDAQETLACVIASKTRGKPLNEKDYKRLSDALLRRGFSWGEVKTALRTAGAALTDADDGL